jgi:hypothetical protein
MRQSFLETALEFFLIRENDGPNPVEDIFLELSLVLDPVQIANQ